MPFNGETLYDMHCHLDFAQDVRHAAASLQQLGVVSFSTSVEPAGYKKALQQLSDCEGVRVGAGLHPWWVAADETVRDQVDQLQETLPSTRYIGEVGLDFGFAHGATRGNQLIVFNHIAAHAAKKQDCLLSVHAVASACDVLEILKKHHVLEQNAVIFHWFSGTSEQLQEAVGAGCYFSINPRMLASKKGRAYVQAISRERLLLETDQPSAAGNPFSAQESRKLLEETLTKIAQLRSETALELGQVIGETSKNLLGFA